jgi:hypothetical protein
MRKPIISTWAILVVSASLAATAPTVLAQQGMMANCNQMMERMNKMMDGGMKTMPMAPAAPAK